MSFIYEIARFLRSMPSLLFSFFHINKELFYSTLDISGCDEEKQHREGRKNIETLFHLLTSLYCILHSEGRKFEGADAGRGRFLCE
jgi:hypothetical protein